VLLPGLPDGGLELRPLGGQFAERLPQRGGLLGQPVRALGGLGGRPCAPPAVSRATMSSR
jgi:hypothetical protein